MAIYECERCGKKSSKPMSWHRCGDMIAREIQGKNKLRKKRKKSVKSLRENIKAVTGE